MTPRERAVMRWGATVAVTGLVLARLAPALSSIAARRIDLWRTQREWLAEARIELAGLAQLEDSAHVLERRVVELAPGLLSGHDDVEAITDLSARLTDLAAHQRLRVVQTESVADSLRAAHLRRVTVRVTLECDVAGLAAILTSVARTPTVFLPRSLEVKAPEPTSPEDQQEVLRVTLRISGWYLQSGNR